jgi:4-hydroxy-3-methylbut-2-enyl diphosphate reductase
MKIKLARTAGFCMGVKKAMDIALDTAHRRKPPIYTFGPLIHNPQTIDLLHTKGIRILQEEDGSSSDGTVIIRAHGISPQRSEEISKGFAQLIDATCPRVKKVQNIIRLHAARGDTVVIVGDKDHPEVDGLLGFSNGKGIVISTAEEIDGLSSDRPICVVAQTTQDESLFDQISRKIDERFPQSKIYNTICEATHKRQSDVLALAKGVDAMIIVGGKKSANTGRLTQLSASTGTPTFHIETEKELDPELLKPFSTIGITAGASTPNWMIKKIIGKVRQIRPDVRKKGLDRLLHLWEFLIKTHLYVALGAAGLSLTNCLIQGIKPNPKFLLVASLYIFSMHLLYRYTDKAAGKFNDPPRAEFYDEREKIFIPMSILGLLLSVLIASLIGALPLLTILLLILLGTLYNVLWMGCLDRPYPCPSGSSKDLLDNHLCLFSFRGLCIRSISPVRSPRHPRGPYRG